jgi:hypothetical protein
MLQQERRIPSEFKNQYNIIFLIEQVTACSVYFVCPRINKKKQLLRL